MLMITDHHRVGKKPYTRHCAFLRCLLLTCTCIHQLLHMYILHPIKDFGSHIGKLMTSLHAQPPAVLGEAVVMDRGRKWHTNESSLIQGCKNIRAFQGKRERPIRTLTWDLSHGYQTSVKKTYMYYILIVYSFGKAYVVNTAQW